jgi:hypothetical protein
MSGKFLGQTVWDKNREARERERETYRESDRQADRQTLVETQNGDED